MEAFGGQAGAFAPDFGRREGAPGAGRLQRLKDGIAEIILAERALPCARLPSPVLPGIDVLRERGFDVDAGTNEMRTPQVFRPCADTSAAWKRIILPLVVTTWSSVGPSKRFKSLRVSTSTSTSWPMP